jgi:hexosaminidase
VFRLEASTTLSAPQALHGVAGWLRATLGPPTGCFLPEPGASAPGAGELWLGLDDSLAAEAYRLEVTPSRVRIIGGGAAGVFYGAQTLRQLLPPSVFRAARTGDGPWEVPAGTVVDAPRFGWRGCLLDVARHLLPLADVRRFIDLLAMHKLNALHLHLTDDQGWRLPVPGWPRLVDVGAGRRRSMVGARRHERYDDRPHGGYYSADDLREIVAYAADRHVRVVPEVDLPGHVGAALAAYPSLGASGLGASGLVAEVPAGWASRHTCSPSPRRRSASAATCSTPSATSSPTTMSASVATRSRPRNGRTARTPSS